jgi:hypothetical protein
MNNPPPFPPPAPSVVSRTSRQTSRATQQEETGGHKGLFIPRMDYLAWYIYTYIHTHIHKCMTSQTTSSYRWALDSPTRDVVDSLHS